MKIIQNPAIQVLIILVLGILAYSNTFHAPFQFDEGAYLAGNPFIKNMGTSLAALKGDSELYKTIHQRYIGYLTFALNYQVHGFAVEGYHAVNLAIHLLNALLVYAVIILTFQTPFLKNSIFSERSGSLAFFSALFFVIHPVQTEAVTYVYQRLTSLAALFCLLSLVSYVTWRLGKQATGGESQNTANGGQREATNQRTGSVKLWFSYLASVISAVLAMKTKENTFTLPLLLTLYEFFFFQGNIRRRVLALLPLLITLCIIPLTLIVLHMQTGYQMSEMAGSAGRISSADYLITQFTVVVTYLRLLFFPMNQAVLYDFPIYRSILHPDVLLSVFFLLSIAGVAIYLIRRSRFRNPELRVAAFGIVWFFLTLSVESSILALPIVICEYRVYLPSVGFFVAVLTLLFHLLGRFGTKRAHTIANFALLSVIAVLTCATYLRNSVWNDAVGLWEDTVKKSPLNALAHARLGLAYERKGRSPEAIREMQRAVNLDAGDAKYHFSLGILYDNQGRFDEAVKEFQTAIELNPKQPKGHYELGVAYARQRQFAVAAKEFQISLAMNPYDRDAHNHLGIVYDEQGHYEDAEREFRSALNIDPDYGEAHNNMGILYKRQGRYEEAIEEFQAALKLNPRLDDARYNLNAVLDLMAKHTKKQ